MAAFNDETQCRHVEKEGRMMEMFLAVQKVHRSLHRIFIKAYLLLHISMCRGEKQDRLVLVPCLWCCADAMSPLLSVTVGSPSLQVLWL
jgi:hypothetical protein